MIKVELDDTIAPGIYIAWGYRHVSYGDVSNIIIHPDMTHICVHPKAIQKETAMLMTKLRADALTARKNRDEVASGLLTALVGEAAMVGKNNGNRETTDEEALRVVKKFLDGAKETRELLLKNGAGETQPIDKANAEIRILEGYMPAQMTEAELRAEIVRFKAENAGANIGAVMKHLQTNFGGTYDGKLASQIAKEA